MFINIIYKDVPELSNSLLRASELDLSMEKTLLVNPDCPVRIMLEYIRKTCRLGIYTQFDLCDESGCLKGLFNIPTYAPATELFEHKKTYYIIVLKHETEKRISVIPQLNHDNRLFKELIAKVKQSLGIDSPMSSIFGKTDQSALTKTAKPPEKTSIPNIQKITGKASPQSTGQKIAQKPGKK